MGHEASGIIQDIGSAVTRVCRGDRVAIEPGIPCRRCDLCKTGKYNLCRTMKFAADPPYTHGTPTRLYKIEEDFVYRISDSLSLEEAVLAEPLSVAVHGIRLADLTPGQTLLVQGSGTVGLLSAAVAKMNGAKRVYISDVNREKLAFAQSFIDCTPFLVDPSAASFDEARRFATDMNVPHGVDVVLEYTGVESSIQTGLYASAVGATFVQIGMGKANLTLPLRDMMEREITLRTSFRYGPGDYNIAVELLNSGKLNLKSMVSSIVPFDQAIEAWEKTKRGEGIKNVIKVELA